MTQPQPFFCHWLNGYALIVEDCRKCNKCGRDIKDQCFRCLTPMAPGTPVFSVTGKDSTTKEKVCASCANLHYLEGE